RCGESTCWYGQISTGESFEAVAEMGAFIESEPVILFDYDGDGRTDLVTGQATDDGTMVTVRSATDGGFGEPVTVGRIPGSLQRMVLRRSSAGFPAELVAAAEDAEGRRATYSYFAFPGRLVETDRHARTSARVLIQALLESPDRHLG